jgi:hypothetical protein
MWSLTTQIEGVDAANPNGSGSGNVSITTTATSAVSYKVDYGDGNVEIVPTGKVTHKYSQTRHYRLYGYRKCDWYGRCNINRYQKDNCFCSVRDPFCHNTEPDQRKFENMGYR